jgi:hypothetical protein
VIPEADLAAIREWVGSQPPDESVRVIYERRGTVEATALAILRARRADFIQRAAKFSADGDFSEDTATNIKALDRDIASLEAMVPSTEGGASDLGMVTTSRLVRAGRGR